MSKLFEGVWGGIFVVAILCCGVFIGHNISTSVSACEDKIFPSGLSDQEKENLSEYIRTGGYADTNVNTKELIDKIRSGSD